MGFRGGKIMSLHKSLKIQHWSKKRNVRKRRERIQTLYAELLKKGGLSEEQIKVYGLPKEKIIKFKKPKKVNKEKNDEQKTKEI